MKRRIAILLALCLAAPASANGKYKGNEHAVQPWCREFLEYLYPNDNFRGDTSEWGPCWAWDGAGGPQPTNGPSSTNSQRPNPQDFDPPPGY